MLSESVCVCACVCMCVCADVWHVIVHVGRSFACLCGCACLASVFAWVRTRVCMCVLEDSMHKLWPCVRVLEDSMHEAGAGVEVLVQVCELFLKQVCV